MISPNGCRYCNVEQQSHYSRWSPAALAAGHIETVYGKQFQNGWHSYVSPTELQIKERMMARRKDHEDAI